MRMIWVITNGHRVCTTIPNMKKKLYRRSLVRVLSRRFLGKTLTQLDQDGSVEAIIYDEMICEKWWRNWK